MRLVEEVRAGVQTNPVTFGTFARAVAFATHAHHGNVRKDKDSSPYITHPVAAVAVLGDEAGVTDWVTLCAAVLHDTIEDTPTTHQDLVANFGREVADIVREVSDDKALPKNVRKALQVVHAPNTSPRAKLVKLADKIANMRDILDRPPVGWSPDRKLEYFAWASQVVAGLRGTHPRLEQVFDDVYARRAELG